MGQYIIEVEANDVTVECLVFSELVVCESA